MLGLAVVATAGITGAAALQGRGATDAPPPATAAPEPLAAASAPAPSPAVPDEASVPPPSSPPAAAPPLSPVVAEGTTALQEKVIAVRAGDTVRVHFDTPLIRTRRPAKFEGIVRATLPAIYGAAADSLLAAIPAGTLVGGAEALLEELPARGIRLALADGWALALWPETRPGRDGPLVVTYRATVTR